MRSVCQSVNLLCTSFGSLSASGLNSLLGAWITPNLNDGKLYLVFFTLGGLMLANAAAFAGLACSFEYSAARTSRHGAALLVGEQGVVAVAVAVEGRLGAAPPHS